MEPCFNTILPFPRSYWVIPGMLLAGHVPTSLDKELSKTKINNLLNSGIRTFINLQEANEVNEKGKLFPDYCIDLKKHSEQTGIDLEFHRISIKDLNIPTPEIMKTILHKIEVSISSGRPVYVHCWGGIGRTGMVIGCFLIQNNYATKNNVIDMIRYLRRTDPKIYRDSPETEEQIEFVLNWKN